MTALTSQIKKYRSMPLLAVLTFFSLGGPHNAEAQSRGKLAYDSSEDAGFLTL